MIDEWTWCQACALVQGGLREACSRCGGPVTVAREPGHAQMLMIRLELALGASLISEHVAVFDSDPNADGIRFVEVAAPLRRISVRINDATGEVISWAVVVGTDDPKEPLQAVEHGEADTFNIQRIVELFKTGWPDLRAIEDAAWPSKCPVCGHHDPEFTWWQSRETIVDPGTLRWCDTFGLCWKCNAPHPTIAHAPAELARLRSEVVRLQASHDALAKIAEDIGEVVDDNHDGLVARIIYLLDQVGPGEPRT